MSNVQCKFKRVIKSAFLLMVLVNLTNCNQFASFNGSEEEAHLSTNPIFEYPDSSFTGEEIPDTGITDTPVVVVDPPVVIPPVVNPPVVTPPVVVVPPNPPFQWCANGLFRVLRPNGQYTECRPCARPGDIIIDDVRVPICAVQVCDGTNQYIFFGNDPSNPSRSCERCDRLNNNTTTLQHRRPDHCTVVVEPPVVVPPPVVTPTRPTVSGNGGGDGGDGGGDPLMIDSQGIEYANAEQLRNSNASYFKSGELDLTAPENGTKFNLLGQQTQAVLNDGFLLIKDSGKNFKYQISWIQPSQKRYQFLALPNAQGKVLGIDQLFGDNTFGPDANRPFAKDGFQALMKHDKGDAKGGASVADGYIDANDAIFSKLRLWHDLNGDGNVDTVAEMATELITLEQAGLTYIHLRANEKFFETDQFGNDIAYKSIVGFKSTKGNGVKLGTAFDMWFQYSPREVLDAGLATKK
jgi:hypothetical protein